MFDQPRGTQMDLPTSESSSPSSPSITTLMMPPPRESFNPRANGRKQSKRVKLSIKDLADNEVKIVGVDDDNSHQVSHASVSEG